MSILDEFKKLQSENVNINIEEMDEDVRKQYEMINEYDTKGTINGKVVEIKQSNLNEEFPEGIDPECERNASMNEYQDGEIVEDDEPIEDFVMKNFTNVYKKYHENDLDIFKSSDYEPVVIRAFCPNCGKEIISTSPVMFNPYTMDKICKYDCECGWKANLDYAYPRFVMRNKNTSEEIEVYAK